MKEQPPSRKRGRPATGISPVRQFRMSDDEWLLIEEAARCAGKTVSEWIRETILAKAKRNRSKE